eukprot:2126769-Rhodomonas_salina.1
MPGTELVYGATAMCLRACYAMSGIEIAYGAAVATARQRSSTAAPPEGTTATTTIAFAVFRTSVPNMAKSDTSRAPQPQ